MKKQVVIKCRNSSSECCFVVTDFEDVLVTVAYLMEKNSSCKFWTTYQERRYISKSESVTLTTFTSLTLSLSLSLSNSSNRTLLPLLDRWGLQCRSIPLETFYSHTPFSSALGEEEEEEKQEKETCRAAKKECVVIEGLSENIIDSRHTIHMWEITKAPRML